LLNDFFFNKEDFVAYDGQCPICLSYDIRKYAEIDIKYNFFFNYCNHCHGVSASHHLTEEATSRFYNAFYTTGDHKGTGIKCLNYHNVIKQFLPYISIKNKEIKLLDFGGGSGMMAYATAEALLERCKINKVHIIVCDYENETVTSANKNINIEKINNMENITNKFDFIITSATMEHITYPHAMLRLLFSLIEEDGYFYIRVPYVMPIYKMLTKIKMFSWYKAEFPSHLHDFSSLFFEKIYDTYNISGFKTLFSAPSCFEYTFRYDPFKAALTRLIRFPYILFKNYPFVGSWSIVSHREALTVN